MGAIQRYANTSGVPLSLAVFLATDHYDHDPDPNTISVTTLIKPLRQTILSRRIPDEGTVVDLASMVNSRMGSAIHDGIERAWVNHHKAAMAALGYPPKVVNRVLVNPNQHDLELAKAQGMDPIPVYLEQRVKRQIGKWKVSGKFDFVGDGRVEDFKSTSVWTYINQTNGEKYTLQGSIYRWLNPEIITSDQMAIQFIFTDWSAAASRGDPRYPASRTKQQVFDLLPVPATETFIRQKLASLERYMDAPENEIPECTDEELWRKDPVFKYYSDPNKTSGRSTRNFTTREEAIAHQMAKGKGVVLEKPGEVTACKYCPAFMACTQKDRLIKRGDLVLGS